MNDLDILIEKWSKIYPESIMVVNWRTAKQMQEMGLIDLSEENKKKIKMYEGLAEGMEYEM